MKNAIHPETIHNIRGIAVGSYERGKPSGVRVIPIHFNANTEPIIVEMNVVNLFLFGANISEQFTQIIADILYAYSVHTPRTSNNNITGIDNKKVITNVIGKRMTHLIAFTSHTS